VATSRLRELASRCDRPGERRRAFLSWAMLELDPRNPDGSPETAARLAAQVLQRPEVPAADLRAAETLYLLAIDRGAEPLTPPVALQGTARPKDGDCPGEAGDSRVARELPEHPAIPLSLALEAADRRADSLARAADREMDALRKATDRRADSLSKAVEEARGRADSLAAELERIRALLSEGLPDPDTTRMRP